MIERRPHLLLVPALLGCTSVTATSGDGATSAGTGGRNGGGPAVGAGASSIAAGGTSLTTAGTRATGSTAAAGASTTLVGTGGWQNLAGGGGASGTMQTGGHDVGGQGVAGASVVGSGGGFAVGGASGAASVGGVAGNTSGAGAGAGGNATGGNASGGVGTGGGSTGTGGAPSPCPSTHACIPMAPTGWEGPLLISNTAASCSGAFPTLRISGGTNADFSGRCECQCGAPTTSTCPTGIVTHYFYSSATCSGGSDDTIEYAGNECFGTLPSDDVAAMAFGTPAPILTCGSGTYKKPQSSFVSPFVGCAAPTGSWRCANATDSCLPKKDTANPREAICIYSAGDLLSCPAPYSSAPYIVFTGLTDQRSCPAGGCSCSGVGGVCQTDLFFFTGSSCAGTQLGSPIKVATQPRTCFTNSPETTHIDNIYVSNFPSYVTGSGACAGTAVAPSGLLNATGVTTLCCLSTLE